MPAVEFCPFASEEDCGWRPRDQGRTMNANRILSATVALALSAIPALAADMPLKARVASAPPPTWWEIAYGGAVMSDYNFRGISQSDRGISGTVVCRRPRQPDPRRAAALRRHPALHHQASDLADRRIRLLRRAARDLRAGAVRCRRDLLLLSERNPGLPRPGHRRGRQSADPGRDSLHQGRHRFLGSVRQGHLDRESLADPRRLRLLFAELAQHRRGRHLRGRHRSS